jgi:diguanylate cyclase (GGDEF)-like protein
MRTAARRSDPNGMHPLARRNRSPDATAPRSVRGVRARLLILGALAAMVASVGVASEIQRSAAARALDADRTSAGVVRSMIEQESALRGFLLTGDDKYLEPWHAGRLDFARHIDAAKRHARDDSEQRELVATLEATARRWQLDAERAIARARRQGPGTVSRADAVQRRELVEAFRAQAGRYSDAREADRDRSLRLAGFVAMAVAAFVSLLLGTIGYFVIGRGARAEEARRRAEDEYRASQDAFSEALQVTRAEREAQDLLRRHLERTTDASIAILTRRAGDARLSAATALHPAVPLAPRLENARPDACVAVRLGRSHESGAGSESLLRCELCDGLGAGSVCVPALVGGESIGSVLAVGGEALDDISRRRVVESVAQAAPVFGNLRNLAIAEIRAATDSLTGLPNQRAATETLKRMAAQASRTVTPLSAVLFDLDHFKEINDHFGHARGDSVLAAVGDRIASGIRASDFAARYGGEEFLALLPETEASGAVIVAEKLRREISTLEILGVERRITASFGVASIPADAVDADSLVRAADRALYGAKAAGRDRVETAAAVLR